MKSDPIALNEGLEKKAQLTHKKLFFTLTTSISTKNMQRGGKRTKSQVLENTTRRHPRICPTGSAKTHATAPASSVDDNNAGPKNLKMKREMDQIVA